MVVQGIDLIAFPVLEPDTERVGTLSREQMDEFIAQPILSMWRPKALYENVKGSQISMKAFHRFLSEHVALSYRDMSMMGISRWVS